jgi:hypothetical protein
MKKFILSLVLVSGLGALHAQVYSPPQNINVPEPVKTRFSNDYPNSTATWTMDESNYAAMYYEPGNSLGRTVVYDKNGTIVRMDAEMTAGTYPLGINDYYSQNYPNESYTIWSSRDMKGTTTYYSKRKGKMIWFDQNGNYMAKPDKRTKKYGE